MDQVSINSNIVANNSYIDNTNKDNNIDNNNKNNKVTLFDGIFRRKDLVKRDNEVANTIATDHASSTYMVYSKEHVEELNKMFPLKQWTTKTTEAELAFNAGQRSVVDSILQRLTTQRKVVLNK